MLQYELGPVPSKPPLEAARFGEEIL